jgi:hypothetical protein
MSSPSATTAKGAAGSKPATSEPATAKPAAAKPAAAAGPADEAGEVISGRAMLLAREIECKLARGAADGLTTDALQALMAALSKAYATRVEAGEEILPVKDRSGLTATDAMSTASGLLRAVNVAVFELGMWQSWTGR